MAGLTETITALKGGVSKMTVEGAVKNIEMWEKELKGVDGADSILSDLRSLKTELHSEKPDSAKIKGLMGTLASGTKKAAMNAGPKKMEVEQLGTELQHAA